VDRKLDYKLRVSAANEQLTEEEWDEYACSSTSKLEKRSSRSREEVHEIKSIIKELELA
jgi:hypothetical protein